MRTIELKKSNDRDWAMQFVDDSHYDECFETNVKIFKPDGNPLMVLLKNSISETSITSAWSVLKSFNLKSRNRGVAAGRKNIVFEGKTKSGKVRTGKTIQSPKGWDVHSGIVGYFERTTRLPYCRSCAWNSENPSKFKKLLPMIKEVDGFLKQNVPERYAVQKEYVNRTSPDFVIEDTVFTTLTINKNFRTACHKDAGDLEAGFSCLSVIKRGKYEGGILVLPNWRVAAKLETGDLIMFDAHEFHGNTQIVPLSTDAERCSIVYYYREDMVKCKSAVEELEQVKNRKLGDPLW